MMCIAFCFFFTARPGRICWVMRCTVVLRRVTLNALRVAQQRVGEVAQFRR
jgi:hypothetical protein